MGSRPALLPHLPVVDARVSLAALAVLTLIGLASLQAKVEVPVASSPRPVSRSRASLDRGDTSPFAWVLGPHHLYVHGDGPLPWMIRELVLRGSLSKAAVRRVVRGHLEEVGRCVGEARGRVVVQFVIGSDGTVLASVAQQSTIGDPPVEQCMVRAARGWVFPASRGLTVVSYPFMLHR